MKAHSWKTPKDLSIIGGPTPSRLTAQNLDSFPPRSPNVTASLLRGGYSAEACQHDSFDYDALRQVLLDPLGPGGDRGFQALRRSAPPRSAHCLR